MLSIIIPAYYEPFLDKTINSIFESVTEDIEIIVVLDGWKPEQLDKRVKVIEFNEHRGMRTAINEGIKQAQGKFILKSDAHCLYAQGFDEILTKDCQESWLMVPRRYVLNEVNWEIKRETVFYDYHYLTFPNGETKWGYALIPFHHWKSPSCDNISQPS